MGGLYKRAGMYLLWAVTIWKRLNSVQRDSDLYQGELNNLVISLCVCYETEHTKLNQYQMEYNSNKLGIDKININFQ